MDEISEDINFRNIKKKLREHSLSKGVNNIQHLYTWDYEGTSILCYGWTDGLPGAENKHDLPPSGDKMISTLNDSDTQLLFGDLFILQKDDHKLCDFDVSDYGLFYSLSFEGFDDCLTDDETDEDEEDDDGSDLNDFIVASTAEDEEDEDEEDEEDEDDEEEDVVDDVEDELDEDVCEY